MYQYIFHVIISRLDGLPGIRVAHGGSARRKCFAFQWLRSSAFLPDFTGDIAATGFFSQVISCMSVGPGPATAAYIAEFALAAFTYVIVSVSKVVEDFRGFIKGFKVIIGLAQVTAWDVEKTTGLQNAAM